jgi:D-glycero-alpha-D-manno-heptose-7-phosphate kinase
MIITKTPVRLPIGGGGTDLSDFYSRSGFGYTLSLTIDKYVFCIVRHNFEKGVRFTGYHKKEIVKRISDLENPIARAVLQYLDFQEDIEIVTISDIRTNCGLGTSSSFVVGLIHALRVYRGEKIDPLNLAKDAIAVERVILNEKGGVQDQYSAALGGLVELQINQLGKVQPRKIDISPTLGQLIVDRVVMYDTNIARISSNVQADNVAKFTSDETKFNALIDIHNIGLEMKLALLNSDLDKIGALMNLHWIKKKLYSGESPNSQFNKFYDMGIKFGAIGGKLMGAGGGGFFLFIVKSKSDIKNMNQEFERIGFLSTPFTVENTGSVIAYQGSL